jgi:hypothetical protein
VRSATVRVVRLEADRHSVEGSTLGEELLVESRKH